MDTDGDSELGPEEWLRNLSNCACLHAALSENVNAQGELTRFQSRQDRRDTRMAQVEELEALQERDEDEEAQLAEYKRQIRSLDDAIEQQRQPRAA